MHDRQARDIVTVGPMCMFAKWVMDLVMDLGAHAHAHAQVPLEIRWTTRSDDVSTIGLGAGKRQLIVTCEPSSGIVDTVRNRDVIVVAIIEDPFDILDWDAIATLFDQLRGLSQASIINAALRENRNVLFVYRAPTSIAQEIAWSIVRHLELELPDDHTAQVVNKFAGDPDNAKTLEQALSSYFPNYRQPQREVTDFSNDVALAVAHAFDPLINIAWGKPIEKVVWSPWLFSEEITKQSIGPAALELAGPARSLFCGPFWCLPPGNYQVTIGIDVDALAIGLRFSIELYRGTDGKDLICKRLIQPEVAGAQFGTFRVGLDRGEDVIDVRLKVLEPCLEGKIALTSVEFLLVSDESALPESVGARAETTS